MTPDDVYLFAEGTHNRLHHHLGAHFRREAGVEGVRFSVWAPNARTVSVVGDFDDWKGERFRLEPGQQGIWSAFVPELIPGQRYKYRIESADGFYRVDKADPFAFETEMPPGTASVLHRSEHHWRDRAWMEARSKASFLHRPMSIYEVHLGSWARKTDAEGQVRSLDYDELARELVPHVKDLGFTHVELMPVMEHPFFGSWGYQCTAYFAPTRRYGPPDGLRRLIDAFHQNDIGVILDWVPSHFPNDEHGLVYFDGTHLFEHADPRQGQHPDWNTAIFNYGRNEVRSFLNSSAAYWLDEFHADGIRVDAVASMLYLDYSRKEGEWVPNRHGGRENLEAMEWMRDFNRMVHADFPGAVTIAEESTAWPMVSRPIELGGLGFTMKWDMGWMHDTLRYFGREPIHRRFHQNELTFRSVYAFNENFVLPLSHDEVVHGKGSLLGRMPGDDWRRHANLRLLYAFMFAQPGKKLLFMGAEMAQLAEWDHDGQLDWVALKSEWGKRTARCLGDLNRLHRDFGALHERDFESGGFDWVDASDIEQSILTFLRRGTDPKDWVLCAFNFTPTPRSNYRLGVPQPGRWVEIFNGDSTIYGGSGRGNMGGLDSVPVACHGRYQSLTAELPPLAAVFFAWRPG